MKTKRFKTKQEFKKEFGISGARATAYGWNEKMDPLYGLPWDKTSRDESPYPDLLSEGGWGVSQSMLTTAPHPYEGKSFKMKVTPEESEAVQKKAFALGYKWISGATEVKVTNNSTIYIHADRIYLSVSGCRSFPELTPQQFMEGEVPQDDFKSKYDNEIGHIQKLHAADMRDAVNMRVMYLEAAGEGKKPDAYIHEGELYIWSGNKEMPANVNKAWMYNLMPEEDFKKKHTPQLKFKGWEVQVTGGKIKVGCVEVTKARAKSFYYVMDTLNEYGVESLDMFKFMDDNRAKLGF